MESLTHQTVDNDLFEVIVVDNNSTDDTQQIAKGFSSKFKHFQVVIESNVGLSYARNKGYQIAKADWVGYLDDDAKAANNFVERSIWVMNHTDYKVFGGVYLPWYKYGKPKWYRDQFGSNKMRYKQITALKTEFISGGIMFFEKKLLAEYNGFSTSLGMIGNQIGYGEETELQVRMRGNQVPIAYDPNIVMYHVVAAYKLDLDWFFKSAYSLGRDMIGTKHLNLSYPYIALIIFVAFAMVFVNLLICTPKLLFKNYYIQNWLIDVFKKPTKRVGIVYTALKEKALDKEQS